MTLFKSYLDNEIEALQSGGDSRLMVEAGDTPALPADGTLVDVTGLIIDSSSGGTISLGGDGKTITFAVAGTYAITAEAQGSSGHTTTTVRIGILFTPFPVAGGNGSGFSGFLVPATDGAVFSSAGIYRIAAGTTLVFKVGATSSTDPTLVWFGADIFRLS